MIDDTGLEEFTRSGRARRWVITLAAISLAACIEEAPPDEALAAELSSDDVLALCDELRDAVQRNDRPIECESGDEYWVLPSNQSCLSADLSACTATVGQLRRCHELARQSPCSLETDPISPVDLSPITVDPSSGECPSLVGCSPFAPTTEQAYIPACSAVGLASLQNFDGVYEVMPTGYTEAPSCPRSLPDVLEPGAPRFVLVSTAASGLPEIILQSCTTLADCQTLARELQATDNPRGAASYNRLFGCATGPDAAPIVLQSVPADVPSCQLEWQPQVNVTGDPSSPTVTVSGLTDMPETSPGCGYIIASVAPYACWAMAEYTAVRVSTL